MAEQEVEELLIYMGFECEFCEGTGYQLEATMICCGVPARDGSCCGYGYQSEEPASCQSCCGQRTIIGRT